MKLKATSIRSQTTEDNKQEIILTLDGKINAQEFAGLKEIIFKGKLLSVEIKQYRAARSLDSNSYCWVLISQIADILSSSKDEIYFEMLNRYGQSEKQLISVLEEAAPMIYRATNNHCREVGSSELNGKLFKHFRILIGSSQYDSLQMCKLIDGIISECKGLGIETITENDKSRMISEWNRG